MTSLYLYGYGVTGKAIARAAGDFDVYATAKSEATRALIPQLKDPFGVDYLVMSAPPHPNDPFLANYANADFPSLKAIVYLSTTAIYGDAGGAWINEETLPNPTSERAKRRLEAEKAWLAFAEKRKIPLTIFRLSGIYGITRNALLEMRNGTAKRIIKDNQYFNRIHEEDIARCVLAFLKSRHNGLVNGADNLPCPSHEVVSYAAKLLNTTPPPLIPFAEANLSEMARSFWAENKRIDNAKLVQLYGQMLYKDYKSGLESLHAAHKASADAALST